MPFVRGRAGRYRSLTSSAFAENIPLLGSAHSFSGRGRCTVISYCWSAGSEQQYQKHAACKEGMACIVAMLFLQIIRCSQDVQSSCCFMFTEEPRPVQRYIPSQNQRVQGLFTRHHHHRSAVTIAWYEFVWLILTERAARSGFNTLFPHRMSGGRR